MSNITKTWFYQIDTHFGNHIEIEKDIYTSLFIKDLENDITLSIWENSKVDLYTFFSSNAPKNISIYQKDNASKLSVKGLFIWDNHNLVSNISSHISGNNSVSHIHIISVVKKSHIGIDSSIHISKDSQKIEASLDLENIFIGKKWTLSSLPNLFIDANDVQVSHSSKTHRIEEDKLFYLESRWLDIQSSIKLMTESYFKKTFTCLEMLDKDLYDNLYEEFLSLN